MSVLVAVLAATLVAGCAPISTGAAGVGAVPPLLRALAREHAAGPLGRGLRGRCSPQLHLRGAGDDEEEGGEEEAAGEDAGDEGNEGEEGGDEDDPDAGPMTITKAIRQVLYHARNHYGVAKGIKEVVQALERGEAQLVILAEDCDHEDYVKLITALTAEKGVYLIKVPERAKLGDWAGQHKLDADANVKKTCPASCVAVKDFGEQSEGLAYLLQYIKAEQGGEGEDDAPEAVEEGEAEAAEDMEEGGDVGEEDEAAA